MDPELIKLKKIRNDKGSVYHIIKNHDFVIQEVYLSTLSKNVIKGWKQHKQMTLNLVVVKGNVKFIIKNKNNSLEYIIGDSNYCRLVIPPMNWFCFEGLDELNMIINCADLIHDPDEVNLLDFSGFDQELVGKN